MRSSITNEMLSALTDAGMETEKIEQLTESIQRGQVDRSKRILATHRSLLLSDLHEKQEKLYCMDFASRKIKNLW